jgi:histidinol-phosphate phosphatase family protein
VTVRRPAVFVDRDGTLIEDRAYVSDPADVHLLPGVASAIAALNLANTAVIVVTNQSGIGRGYYTMADYERVRARLDELLAAEFARVDATYVCPHAPDASPPCACRKPETELFERAILEHHLDPASSVFIGDRWRDVEPALFFGARGVLVPTARTPAEDLSLARREASVAATLADAIAGS